MIAEMRQPVATARICSFRVEGRIQREQPESDPGELRLMAYVFDKVGTLLGSAALDDQGNYVVAMRLSQPADVELIVGPADMPQQIRRSSAYRKSFSAEDWKAEDSLFRLRYDTVLPQSIWRGWMPLHICVSGHVHKVSAHDPGIYPVPFVKVEIFDVDRGPYVWPLIRRWWQLLLDRPVFRMPDLQKDPPVPLPPFPGPDPVPDLNLATIPGQSSNAARVSRVGISPQPEPPMRPALTWLNPQPEPPIPLVLQTSWLPVGESRQIDSTIATRLSSLTLTSKIAPWHTFPRSFYSTMKVGEATTDCDGYFSCSFKWPPLHYRCGRLRFDLRPDIIVKVTQFIDGVATVIYLDPYTSTRWNYTNLPIDLCLDDEEVVVGNGVSSDPPAGSVVFFTRIGDDEVYQINQTTGLYKDASLANVAYGGTLLMYGQFGDALTTGTPRYYRLSYAKQGSTNFIPITTPLTDTRVAKGTLHGETYTLGPMAVNSQPALYKVRDFSGYYWYNPDWIGTWYSWLAEADTGTYVLRLELFDEKGVKLTTAMGIDYRNGASADRDIPPDQLSAMTDCCDLVITLDNQAPVVELTIPGVLNECGVIPSDPVPQLNFQVHVSQKNNRLYQWGLYYTKGVNSTTNYLSETPSGERGAVTFNAGTSGPIAPTINGAELLTGLTSTCAFALKLWAWAHVRDGRSFIYCTEELKAIAIEKCAPCPRCP